MLSMGTAASHEAAGVGGEIHLHEERGRGRSQTATQSRPTPCKSKSRTPARTTATSSNRRHRSPSRTTSRIPLQVSIAAEVKRLSRRGPLRELGARREETATSALRDSQMHAGTRSFMGRTFEMGLFSNLGLSWHPDGQRGGTGADYEGMRPARLEPTDAPLEPPHGAVARCCGQRALPDLAPRDLMIDLRTDRENRKLLGSAGVLFAGSSFETTARHKRSLGAAVRLHLPGPKAVGCRPAEGSRGLRR